MIRALIGVVILSVPAAAQTSFLPDALVAPLAAELSGESAKRNLEFIARHHRTRGSRQYRMAADHIVATLQSYGFTDAHVERFPADGKIYYGTQRSRPAWNADFAELWDVSTDRRVRLASWESMPITLAQDSESADVTAELVDVGIGTEESDYAGKNIAGKLVLTSSQPGAITNLAVGKHRAAGIISYAQNQRTAWWGEDENLIRWGHLDTFSAHSTFGFMISLKQARDLQRRLRAGETVRLHAVVRAAKEAGFYEIPMATIAGAEGPLRDREIIYSCHLDHPRPGANDNASGCAAILEVARTLSKLIDEERLPRPARTMRFVWPPEIEGTLALLNGRPELTRRIDAAIHLDMVGGGPNTKAIFHITRGPASLPSFINDVTEEIGRFVNRETARFAMTGTARFPLVSAEGGKEALQAEMVPLTLGSDHQVYTDSSFGIPAVYLNDWPDRYIHTNFDTPANIDPTKLKRAAFIAAAAGYYLADFRADDVDEIVALLERNALRRKADLMERTRGLDQTEAANVRRFQDWYERTLLESIGRFAPTSPQPTRRLTRGVIYRRNPDVKGPTSAFGYDYFEDKYGSERARKIRLSGEQTYEILNLVDGRRTIAEIRDDVSAIYGPISIESVTEYLRALESIGLIQSAVQ